MSSTTPPLESTAATAFPLLWWTLVAAVIVSSVILTCWFLKRPGSAWQPLPAVAPATMSHVAASERFTIRLAAYERKLSTLDTNLKLQGLLAVLCLGVALSSQRTHSVGGMSTEVPTLVLLALLPLSLMFLWLQFGYLLNHLIDARLTLFSLAEVIEPLNAAHDPTVQKVRTLHSVINDGGFLDAWFRAFLGREYIHGVPQSFVSKTGNGIALFVVYGSLLGGSHAAMLFALSRGIEFAAPESFLARLFLVALISFGSLLVLTHLQFYFAGRNRNWQHVGIAVFLCIFLWSMRQISNEMPHATRSTDDVTPVVQATQDAAVGDARRSDAGVLCQGL